MKYKRGVYQPNEVIRSFGPDDIASAEERYRETNDPAFIALAIGTWPSNPPSWAMEAAAELSHAVSLNHQAGQMPDLVGLRLDRMILEYCRIAGLPPPGVETISGGVGRGRGKRTYPSASLDALIKKALGYEAIEEGTDQFRAARDQLIRAWKREAGAATERDLSGMPLTERYTRVALEALDESGVSFRRNKALIHWLIHRPK